MTYTDYFSKFGSNRGYVEELYRLFLLNPALVNEPWRSTFESFDEGSPGSLPQQTNGSLHAALPDQGTISPSSFLEGKVYQIVEAYRREGHRNAKINPLHFGRTLTTPPEELDLSRYNLSETDLQSSVSCFGFGGHRELPLEQLLQKLNDCYCGSTGYDIAHISENSRREWIQQRIESERESFSTQEHLFCLQKVIEAEIFEAELHRKYIGSKRFSLQGGETLIPMLSILMDHAARKSYEEIILGMAHRGRLNVLANVFQKKLEEIFFEFEDQNIFTVLGSGDVKYHIGFETTVPASNGDSMRLCLFPNPSHLEAVDPVIEGTVRARQDIRYGRNRRSVLPLLIHGDAAFIGQGVVTETLNLSLLEGYHTGGTVHIVINNQLGFTANPDEYRSTAYCTDFARAVQAPIFHVNGEDVEAACRSIALAFEYRDTFLTDVVIDLYCYRKYGHNEGDDPSFTQPRVYEEISKKKAISDIYSESLIQKNLITAEDLKRLKEGYNELFQKAFEEAKSAPVLGEACPMHGRLRVQATDTAVSHTKLRSIAECLIKVPEEFSLHPKLEKILKRRHQSFLDDQGIEWGLAEALSFGSLLQDGFSIRLVGQDSGRGTFSQRHLLFNDYERGSKHRLLPLMQIPDLSPGVAFEVINSSLSEEAALGFEFGYSSSADETLVLWEAQFGDFVNGAQTIIDQFLVSSEQKWNLRSGVVLLLPHGYEGQGPEHSSARMERFLQLCADGNIVICNPSTAGQYFHLLRRQAHESIRRPMIIFTPKSLLRHPGAAASQKNLSEQSFETVIESDYSSDDQVDTVIFCCGKIFHELDAALKGEETPPAVRVVRVEQLYPFPQFEMKKTFKHVNPKRYLWVQEEPRNMGAWTYIEPYFRKKLGLELEYIGRPVSASTATGSSKRHMIEQEEILQKVRSFL